MSIRQVTRTVIAITFISGLSSCTGGMPSISGLGAGSDSAYLNANRGRRDAQISSAQATQYSRQRRQVSEEMQLEQQKRSNFIQNTQGIMGILGGFR